MSEEPLEKIITQQAATIQILLDCSKLNLITEFTFSGHKK
ncbi:Putative uncharacterized protein [Lactobacillus helveticus CIRM-BIA 101]|jgi:hypothetical protein|uniref:Uncharacterized protein n=3 Tax=Lactobacillus helveticus TaxID=1587 RepID=A0A2X0RVN0_LACHE|nr:hypothetical protein lhe_1555 [Lactobacillus helveticus CNRZ32]EEW67061.1 hypothetical protein HMPREF0518_1960 [Lactobacillus helveticus DSM 20075 = CGMCC 1.1877]EGF35981.1 hypothetical protein AAULH_09713 [Lactobacillus helveticus MTCC 5463]NRN73403.1 hypothetical protein [Lactobacillus helveticus]CDI59116.1 Putative uncharacterized protein [Lactobacillus helveticus CIRM-BIA 951]CDI61249.1 Putative uncharacterized protein [Lactobacillus helveticus CIRM-BIA 104]CDI62205.1 Putative uncharac